MPGSPTRRLRDEEIVAASLKAVLENGGTVAGQETLRKLVVEEFRREGVRAGLTAERTRRLAARSGLVGVVVRVRHAGPTPELDACLVCGSALARTANRTLTGGKAATGYRCPRCGWWTGRDFRVPARYTFTARLERKGAQTRFRAGGSL